MYSQLVFGCSGIGGSDDSRIYTNPSITWQMSPPAAWTYPVSYAQQTGQYFPQQPLTQQDAQTQAQGDIQAAVLSALSENNIPTQSVRVVAGYTPQEVSNCITIAATGAGTNIPQQTAANTEFGYEESGAITQLITPTAAIAVTACAQRNYGTYTSRVNIVQGSAQIEGITVSGYQLRLLVATLQSNLNFNYHVRFQSPITYN
ncbi:unnamed protein product [Bursaphelenchus okinawaensis]|uniref:Uncharacterized protein n=1 Tax=Bursaphelenchus okinawaensis TaxID=465554 RepID=A0A811L0T5_9BILA|nr:unnamed protein product [Bursaphelenchus okinawaensis]CAG9114459.1 unnamed protein product [Bursaphelenchus okinawaensis]